MIRRVLGRIRSKEASSIPKRKRSHDDVAGRFITLTPTVENSLLQVDTRELCKEVNRAIAVAYLQGINWARSAAMIFSPLIFFFF